MSQPNDPNNNLYNFFSSEEKQIVTKQSSKSIVFEYAKKMITRLKDNPKLKDPKIWGVIFLIFLVILLGSFYRQNQNLKKEIEQQKNSKQSQAPEQTETKELLAQVGKLIVLPENEQPTVATITNLEKLQGKPFFNEAKLGDKVLIYNVSKKAVLYRPSENKIVEIAPLNVNNPGLTGQSQKINLEIRNASGKSNASINAKNQLANNPNFEITLQAAAAVYKKSIIYTTADNVSNSAITDLAKNFSAQIVTELPSNEKASSADAILIIGQS